MVWHRRHSFCWYSDLISLAQRHTRRYIKITQIAHMRIIRVTHIQIYINICCHVLIAAICITMNELCTNTKIFLHTPGLQYFLFFKNYKIVEVTYLRIRFSKVNPANIYLFKVKNRNTSKRCEICSKLKTTTPGRRHTFF